VNRLYFGDNLHVLRDRAAFPDDCVDLIYLDPPFNSKRDYNLLFKTPPKVGRSVGRAGSPLPAAAGADASKSSDGRQGTAVPTTDFSSAQITAFEDSWHWGNAVAAEFEEIVHCNNTEVSEMMQALRRFIGDNDMMAYLTMMANRLLELHRVLKPTGSLLGNRNIYGEQA
jgi:site-specific DNA-methyltransferase (adenine-specific)